MSLPAHDPLHPEPPVSRLESAAPERLTALEGVKGVVGTDWRGGRPVKPRDPLSDPRTWGQMAEEMLRDSRVSLATQVRLMGVRAAGLTVEPSPNRSPLSGIYAETVRRILGLDGEPGKLRRPFGAIWDEAAWSVYFGAYPMEVIWSYDPETRIVHPVDIEARIPSSIDRWGDGDELGPLTQRVTGFTRQPEPIPARKLLAFTVSMLGSDWGGYGVARAMHAPWQQRTQEQDLMMVGLKRAGLRPPEVRYDPNAIGGDAATVERLVNQAVELAARVYAGEQVVTVGVMSGGTAALETIWHTDDYDPSRVLQAIDQANRDIYAAAGVEHLVLGLQRDTSGNRSLGELGGGVLQQLQVRDADGMVQCLNGAWRPGGGLVGAIIEMAHADYDPGCLPTIRHTGLEVDAMGELLPLAPSLVTAGLLVPDLTMRDRIRALVDAPQLDPEQEDAAWSEHAARQMQAAPGGGMFTALRRRQEAQRHG